MAIAYEQSEAFQRYKQGSDGQRWEGLPTFEKDKDEKLIVQLGERYCRTVVNGRLCSSRRQYSSRMALVKHIKKHTGCDVAVRQTVDKDGTVKKSHGLSVNARNEAEAFYVYLGQCHDAFVAEFPPESMDEWERQKRDDGSIHQRWIPSWTVFRSMQGNGS